MGALVHLQKYRGELNLDVEFIMYYSATLINRATVSHMVFSVPVRVGDDEHFWSIQGDEFYDP